MLNIPSEVKALFSGDAVHKNFHAHFPNGETTDLNNENILSESIQFTESLCSQQYFKFGLAEASQIEFTAVNVPNVRGAYIECAIEIDCTSLGTTWANNHPVDSTLPFLTPQTCTYQSKMYYRVPYGRFKVDTCPRDHGAMYQRRITAYSDSISSNNAEAPYEKLKTGLFAAANLPNALKDGKKNYPEQYRPNLVKWAMSNLFWDKPDSLVAKGYERTLVRDLTELTDSAARENVIQYEFNFSYSGHVGITDEWWDANKNRFSSTKNHKLQVIVKTYFKRVILLDTSNQTLTAADWDRIYELSIPGFEKDWMYPLIIDRLETENILDYEGLGYSSLEDLVRSNVDLPDITVPEIKPENTTGIPGWCFPILASVVKFGDMEEHRFLEMEKDDELFYPGGRYGQSELRVYVPTRFTATVAIVEYNPIEETVVYSQDVDISTDLEEAKIYSLATETTTALDSIQLNFGKTLEQTKSVTQQNSSVKKFKVYSYENAFSLLNLTKGFLEICGWFLKPNRNGALDFFEMSANPTAIAVPRSDWSKFWWDETPIEPIGQVKIIYTGSREEEQQTFTIGDGKSVYTMLDNEMLISTEVDDTTLQSILDTFFAPNASVVNFTPADVTMRGLPFLETGDYIQMVAEDDTEVETYILEMTITGIQHLRAEITSTNGELLEVIENEE